VIFLNINQKQSNLREENLKTMEYNITTNILLKKLKLVDREGYVMRLYLVFSVLFSKFI
jgi:hypothetical protein